MLATSTLARAAFAVLAAAGVAACTGAPARDEVQAELDRLVAEAHAGYATGRGLPEGAGLLVHLATPRGTWTASAGLPAGTGEGVHYRVASVSKTFTAAAIMLLDQEGKLRLDDVVTATVPGGDFPYLPASDAYALPHKAQITIAHLLAHRAGVFDVFNDAVPESAQAPYRGQNYVAWVRAQGEPDHQFTIDELLGVVAGHQLAYFRPGTAYHYSDAGYLLLAKIVERVSGRDYAQFLAERFWGPMGLTGTSAPWSAYDTGLPAPFLRGFTGVGQDFYDTTEDNMSCQVGPGNVVSTPGDMGRWIRGLLSGRGPLTPAQVARMAAVAPGNVTYGLGIGRGGLGLGHSGAHPGYMNVVMYHPGDDVAVVVVTPFIEYDEGNARVRAQQEFMLEVGRQARAAAGYRTAWRTIDDARATALQQALDAAAARAGIPGAVLAVTGPGGLSWSGVTGLSDLAGGTPMAAGLRSRVGSVTKTFTATLVLQLVKEGRLGLDQSLESLLPGAVPGGEAITVRQLLDHTSGLFDYAQAPDPDFLGGLYADRARRWTPAELVAIASAHGPYFAPGAGFHYSNTNYVLLGQVVEALTGDTFAHQVQARILQPLALHDTSVPSGEARPAGSTHGYTWVDGGWVDTSAFDVSWAFAAGEVISTAPDLLQWVDALLEGALLDDALTAAQQDWVEISADLGYGLGLERQRGFVGHTGDFVFGGQAAMYRGGGWRLVVLTNASPSDPGVGFGSEYVMGEAVRALGLGPASP